MALRVWAGLFLMGAINNLPYVLVNSAGRTIADSFGETNLLGLVFWANVSLAFLVKSLNTFLLLKVPYGARIFVNGLLMLAGLFGVAYSTHFWMSLVFIGISGSSAAFGENVTLGYLKNFPSKMVSAWSSGTGMAGVLGAGLYVIYGCTVKDTSVSGKEQLRHLNKLSFQLTAPVVLIYWIAFFFLIKVPDNPLVNADKDPVNVIKHHRASDSSDSESESLLDKNTSDVTKKRHKESALRRYWRCLKLVSWLAINLSAVYMFEYIARGCASKVRPKSDYNTGCPQLYAALQFCYQAGVFASRSSVQFIQITRVEILSILQFINMVVWLLDVHWKFMPEYILPAYMIFIGLLGGASYVNIFYLLLNDSKYPQEDREVCINITALFITVGITLGSGLETAVFSTLLKND